MMPRPRLRKLLPVLIVLLAAALATGLVLLKRTPPKTAAPPPGALVEVVEVSRRDHPLVIRAAGTVQASRQIILEPQVSGRVTALGQGFAAGAFFRQGELLVQLEATDYQLAVEQAAAALARAEVELATTESQAAIARLEWERLRLQEEGEPNPLALFAPQLKNARANLASARASLDQARLNLARTTLRAPFDARVRSKQVDVGQLVRPGTSVATLIATGEAEVIVSLPFDDLAWLQIPGPAGGGGSPATVSLPGDGASWSGVIDRALGEVDPRGRMLQVAVRVPDPYRLRDRAGRPPYLEIGQFVEVTFAGPQLEQVVVLPRRALRDGGSVWLIDAGERLRLRSVEVLRLERDQVLIGGGLDAGERVVLTTLAGAVEGLPLRVAAGEPQ